MHLADLVDQPGVKQDALGRGGLAGVDVRGDPDVARPLQRVLPVGRVQLIWLCLHLLAHTDSQ